jgi:hypothetical protein
MRAVRVEILHLVLFHTGSIDCIGGAKAMFKGCAGANISQLGLDHCTQVAGGMMSEFEDFARLAFKNYNHTAPNLSCRDSHKADVSVKKGRMLARSVV